MRFTRIGELDVVTRIIGPHHHFLAIQFLPSLAEDPPVLERVSEDGTSVSPMAGEAREALCREVLGGVAEANNRLGTNLGVGRIRVCGDDPRIPGVYGQLAEALVGHVVEQPRSGSNIRNSAEETRGEAPWLSGLSSSEATIQPQTRTNEMGQVIHGQK